METNLSIATPNPQIVAINVQTRERITEDLKYWANKKAHFERQGNQERVKVCQLMLNKYLDDYNTAII